MVFMGCVPGLGRVVRTFRSVYCLLARRNAPDQRQFTHIASDVFNAAVDNATVRQRLIEQHKFGELRGCAWFRPKAATREQCARQHLTKKPAPSRDDDSHVNFVRAAYCRQCESAIIVF